MAWIELHQSVVGHRKTYAVADNLDLTIPQTIGHLSLFWLWIVDNTTDGRLEGVTERTIARVAMWPGDAHAFVAALIDAGYLDQNGDTLTVHDWYAYFGRLADAREKNREKQQRYRERHLTIKAEAESASPNRHVTVTSRLDNGATVPNPTVQNSTEPNTMRAIERLFSSPSEQTEAPTPEKPKRTRKAPAFGEDTIPYKLTGRFVERVVARDPDMNIPKPGSARHGKWVKEMADLLTRRTPEQVAGVIDWCTADGCWWSTRVLAVSGLCKHFDTMYRQMSEPKRVNGHQAVSLSKAPVYPKGTKLYNVDDDAPEEVTYVN